MSIDWAVRREVWTALSDVFLDTETRWYFPRIALVLLESGYSVEVLDRIWFFEVVPEFSANLLMVAGESAVLAVDEASLRRLALRRPSLWQRLWARGGWSLKHQWSAILTLREALAGHEPPVRAATASAWSAFAHAYLEPSLDQVLLLDRTMAELRETRLGSNNALSTFRQSFRPVYRLLLEPDERPTEVVRAENVEQLIALTFL